MKGILISDDGDLQINVRREGNKITQGLVIGTADADIAERIIMAHPGEFKEAPTLGGNAQNLISGTPDPFWRGEIKEQLESEHISVKQLNITEKGIELEIDD